MHLAIGEGQVQTCETNVVEPAGLFASDSRDARFLAAGVTFDADEAAAQIEEYEVSHLAVSLLMLTHQRLAILARVARGMHVQRLCDLVFVPSGDGVGGVFVGCGDRCARKR